MELNDQTKAALFHQDYSGARRIEGVEIVELRRFNDDGGAITAAEIRARHEALQPLARGGRRALVAAGSPEVWPPDSPRPLSR